MALLMAGGLVTLTIYSLPMLLKSKILTIVQQETGRKATLAKVQFALLPLSVQLQNFAIQETDGKPFASVDRFYMKVNILQSLTQSTLVIDKLTLINPVVHLVKLKNGKFNVDDLFFNSTNKQQSMPVFPFNIISLSLSKGKLVWENAPIKETIQPINFTIDNFSTTVNKQSPLTLQLSFESGGQLSWQGELGINPFLSKGHIQLNNLKLQRLLTFVLPTSIRANFNGYELFNTDYKASYTDKQFSFVANKAKLELRDFQYAEKNFVIKTPNFTHETDIKITYAKEAWLFTANKSKINLRTFEFSGLSANKTLIKTPSLSYETDFKINYAKNDWQFAVNKSKIAATNVQLSIAGQTNLAIKAAKLNHEVDDYKAKTAENSWNISAKNTKIDAHDFELGYLNTRFKAPAIALETGIESHLSNDSISVTTKQGKLNGSDMQLFETDQDKSLIDVSNLALNGVDFNLNNQSLALESVLADGADLRTWLTPKGEFNYQHLFTPPKIKTIITPITESKSTPWAIKINHIALSNFGASFEDRTLKKPVIVIFKPIDFKLTAYSNKTGVKMPVQLNAGINNTGSIQLIGDTILEPFSVQLAVDSKAIELEPFQAYLEKIAHLDIIEGQFASHGKLAFAIPDNEPLDLKFTSDASISDFTTRDQKRHKDFIRWESLTLKALVVDLRKDSYTADTLVMNKPYVKITIKKDKTNNFSDIFITDSADKKTPIKVVTQHAAYFQLNKVQIIDGSSDFADRSLILPFATQIKSLDGGASDISSDKKSIIKVSLKGNAYDLAPVDIDGSVSPYLGNYDLTLNFKGMPMPLISPYMVEFAGYKVEKGKMSLKLKYKVVDGELTASNNIVIDQFELGEKVNNPKAVSLPLEMAVALLKDSDGRMIIDVPITGRLDDPQFDIGALISDALVGAISKVVTSPFRALASLTDSDADISTIQFSAGNAVLDKAEEIKLTTLAKLLKERSALILDIKGTAFKTQDWPAMKEAALYDLIKTRRADEINKQQGSKKTLAEHVELSDSDYKRLLADLFIEKFPQLAKKSLVLGTPELIDTKAGDFYEVAKQHLSINLKSEQPRLKDLAARRARAIANYLVLQNGVPNEQVFILDPIVDPQRDNNEIASVLSLKAN
jgi:outer membrane protein OmpA-like peptidoglycan-associated protein